MDATSISFSLVREFLKAHGYTATIDAFKKEEPGNAQSVSSKKELAQLLGISHLVKESKQSGNKLPSFLEIVADDLLKRAKPLRQEMKTQTLSKQHVTVDDIAIEDLDLEEYIPTPQQMSTKPSGQPLSPSVVKELRQLLFPSERTFNQEWSGKGFVFSQHQEVSYGLVQLKGGPCGLLASVQAFVIKKMTSEPRFKKSVVQGLLRPSVQVQQEALVEALAEMIWQAGDGTAFVCISGRRSPDVISQLSTIQVRSHDQLIHVLEQHLGQFQTLETYHGLIQFLVSVILTRGIQTIQKDMDQPTCTLMGRHGYCTQEMVNLLTLGYASSNAHDGAMEFGGSTLKGILGQAQVGQLSLFEHYEHIIIGNALKNPRYPIWIVCSESHYSVFFQTNDSHCLFYYDGLAGQSQEIKLVLQKGPPKPSEYPLEHVIRTKWKLVNVQWHGSEPLL